MHDRQRLLQEGEWQRGQCVPAAERLWAAEISLDLDMVSAVCPKCHILLVEARSNGYLELAEAENEAVALGATELNDSWGGPEFSNETKYDSYFDHPGVPITVAGGDTGGVVTYPAATPSVDLRRRNIPATRKKRSGMD